MMMSRATMASKNVKSQRAQQKAKAAPKMPQLEEYIQNRDYTGALALLDFNKNSPEEDTSEMDTLMWIGYCAFHLGNYSRAQEAYQELIATDNCPEEVHLYVACCLYYLQMYSEAEEAGARGPDGPLKTRLLFHVAHKMNDENKLMMYHQKLTDTNEDQLCLAGIHYLRSHFQEATDIYKRLLLENRDDLALNVYVAMCYYKLDYYDVSLEILAVYLQVAFFVCLLVARRARTRFFKNKTHVPPPTPAAVVLTHNYTFARARRPTRTAQLPSI